MPRNPRTTPDRKDSAMRDRSRPQEGTKMHGSRSNESDRETRMGRDKESHGGSRKSAARTRHGQRGH